MIRVRRKGAHVTLATLDSTKLLLVSVLISAAVLEPYLEYLCKHKDTAWQAGGH